MRAVKFFLFEFMFDRISNKKRFASQKLLFSLLNIFKQKCRVIKNTGFCFEFYQWIWQWISLQQCTYSCVVKVILSTPSETLSENEYNEVSTKTNVYKFGGNSGIYIVYQKISLFKSPNIPHDILVSIEATRYIYLLVHFVVKYLLHQKKFPTFKQLFLES